MPRFKVTFVPASTEYRGPLTDGSDETLIRHAMAKYADYAKDVAHDAMSPSFARLWWPIKSELADKQPTVRCDAGDDVTVNINQADRDGVVLALLGDECIVEYVMPAGSSSLYIALATEPAVKLKSVAYHKLTKAWRKAIAAEGLDWEGTPQQSQYDFVLLLSDGRIVGVNSAGRRRTGWGGTSDGVNWTSMAAPCC